jgi:DnaJ-class molecular chaperone
MLPCNECHGSGLATCPQCDGLGYVEEVRGSGEMESHACGRCHGRKSARCDTCGGIGWLGADNVVPLPVEYAAAEEDLLAGYRDGGRSELAAIERLVSGDW